MSTPLVEARDIVKRYGPTVALGGIDLQVPAGSILGMLGPNGAGKLATRNLPDFDGTGVEVINPWTSASG